MQILREKHQKTPEHIKDLLIKLIVKYELDSSIRWNEFVFEGKSRGTTIRGQIFDSEIHIEVSGWFEKIAAQKLRNGWKSLVLRGDV